MQYNRTLSVTAYNIHIMRNQHNRNAALLIDCLQVAHHSFLFQRILAIGNFVQNQCTRIKCQRRCYAKAALLSEGQQARVLVLQLCQAHSLQRFVYLTLYGCFRQLFGTRAVSNLIKYSIL